MSSVYIKHSKTVCKNRHEMHACPVTIYRVIHMKNKEEIIMANWEYIMECYESNDCESLGDYAVAHINKLMDYFESYLHK